MMDEKVLLEAEDGSPTIKCHSLNLVCCGSKRKDENLSTSSDSVAPCPPSTPEVNESTKINSASASMYMSPSPKGSPKTVSKWFQTTICPLPAIPSADLEIFLSSCGTNVKDDIMRKANIILGAIFPVSYNGRLSVHGSLSIGSLMGSSWADERKCESLKLYLRVLESVCKAESQKLRGKSLSCLLANDRFHRCMIVCSAELVSARYLATGNLFPALMDRTGITAFDLTKVIETFIRHESSLPRELKRHLNSLEEQLLESMVWAKGSSLYNYLTVARPSLSAEINRLEVLVEPMPSLDSIALRVNFTYVSCQKDLLRRQLTTTDEMKSPKRLRTETLSTISDHNSFTTPVKNPITKLHAKSIIDLPSPLVQSAFVSPAQIKSHNERTKCADTGINIIFNKVAKLAAVRINGLAERLHLSEQIRENIYSLFQNILIQKTYLFFNRHIDQIILCCFYGVAKVSKVNVSFKDIIENYSKQTHCKSQNFRSVFVKWSPSRCNGRNSEDHIGIIKFYNEIFIQTVKTLMDEISSHSQYNTHVHKANKTEAFPASPRMSQLGKLPDISPRKVSASHNVYLSPLRQAKKDALISRATKSYYACVGESTHAYQSPSKDLADINNSLCLTSRKAKIKLDYTKDAHLVSDSLVTGSLLLPEVIIKAEPKDHL